MFPLSLDPASVDLDSSSLDDVRAERAERAAIALSVGLSWPSDRRRRSRRHPSLQQLWERALQEHILHHRELPRGVRLRLDWWQLGDAIARPLTHEGIAHTSTPCAPRVQPLHSLKTSPAAARQNVAKSRPTTFVRDLFCSSSSLATGGQNGNGAYHGAWVRSGACAPGCSTGSTGTLPTAGNGARQHRMAGKVCSHPQT